MQKISEVQKIMIEFAERTGLTGKCQPRRYLWTDAFAVCNFLGLFTATGEEKYKQYALDLIEQVHNVLGRHRPDDIRTGWISGLDEENGKLHPTAGGLRIGKRLNERRPGEPHDEQLEWEQDGQYFHYLTKWMHALNRAAVVTGTMKYNQWALELARTAHAGFTYTAPDIGKRMYWKMSIDLSRPLVPSMGQHDALDAMITYYELTSTAASCFKIIPKFDLSAEIEDAATMCMQTTWATDDPLGIGGLLSDACRLTRLIVDSRLPLNNILAALLYYAGEGLEYFVRTRTLDYAPEYRLAFRELGLSTGLHAVDKIQLMIERHAENLQEPEVLDSYISGLAGHLKLAEIIENFWMNPANQKVHTWTEHLDINSVMLATSLAPDSYLTI